MRALCWHGKATCGSRQRARSEHSQSARCDRPRHGTAICGSDLHLYDGYIPTMEERRHPRPRVHGRGRRGRPRGRRTLKVGDRVVVPFTIACGSCFFCKQQLWSLCDNSNPNAWMAEKLYGYSPAGPVRLLAHDRRLRGRAGGVRARAVRRRRAAARSPTALRDEQVLFLSDIFPTGYMAAENCDIQPGDTVAVWGCGPVGQFAIRSAFLLGAERVIAIDRVPERLRAGARRRAAPRRSTSTETDVCER